MKVNSFQIGLILSSKILFPALGATEIINLAGTTLRLFTEAIRVAIIVKAIPTNAEIIPIFQSKGIGKGIGSI